MRSVARTLGGSGGGTFGLIIVLDLLKSKKTQDLMKHSKLHRDINDTTNTDICPQGDVALLVILMCFHFDH